MPPVAVAGSPPRGESPLWQHPFVDVFKVFGIDTDGCVEKKGDVQDELDRQICKRVFRIRGAVSANNYLLIPGPRAPSKSLGLTGEYVYLHLKAMTGKYFLVHLDLSVATISSFRITLSNMYSEVKASYHTLQCPLALESDWTVVCLHLPSALSLTFRLPKHAGVLKSVQLCASLVVRNVYTSDTRYSLHSMPREMRLDIQHGCEGAIDWVDLPMPQEAGGVSSLAVTSSARPNTGATPAAAPVLTLPPRGVGEAAKIPDPFLEVTRLVGISQSSRRLAEAPGGCLPRRFAVFANSSRERDGHVWHGNGVPVRRQGFVNFAICASSMTLATVDPHTGEQKCYCGHSSSVDVLQASDDGMWAASVQGSAEGGAAPLLRLWRVEEGGILNCVSVLPCPALSSVHAVAFDPEVKYIALAGVDLQGRQQLRVWDVGRVASGGSDASLLARQLSPDWDIQCLKFSPFERMQLVTCGKESIRFWRIKEGHIPGRSIVLNSLARQATFTCIAFEFNKLGRPYTPPDTPGVQQRMFVGTSKGKLLQFSYGDQSVQAVFSLHDDAITDICANESCLVSASVDKYVRVWPLDFKSFYLHALHDSAVAGIDLSADGLQVLCCTADGAVGLLDLQSHNYMDLVHSHGGHISDAALSVVFQELATASTDGMLKIWSLKSMAQTHEFCIPEDVPVAVAYHPGRRHLVAVGFDSGALRIFDVDAPAMLHELHSSTQAILSLVFVEERVKGGPPARTQIVTCNAIGSLTFHDEACCFEAVRRPEQVPCVRPPERCNAIACIPPYLLQYLDPQHAGLFSFPGLDAMRRLRAPSSEICSLDLSFRGDYALLGTLEARIHLFATATGLPVVTYTLPSSPLTAVALVEPSRWAPASDDAPPLLLAATADMLVRAAALPVEAPPQHGQQQQLQQIPSGTPLVEQCFIGHASAAHRVLLSQQFVVTASRSEIVCWSTSGGILEKHFLAAPGRSTCSGPETGLSADVELMGADAVRPMSDDTEPDAAASCAGLASGWISARSEEVDEGYEEEDEEEQAEDEDHEDEQEGEQEEEEEEEFSEEFVRMDTADVGSAARWPAIRFRRSVAASIAGSNLRMRGVAGCTVLHSRQAFAWQPHPGILCHTVGCLAHVQKLTTARAEDPQGHEACVLPGEDGAFVASLPGAEALALDLDQSGRGLLVALSVDRPGAGGVVWLSCWCLGDLSCLCKRQLPQRYSCASQSDSESSGDVSEEPESESLPIVRMFGEGDCAVTATALRGGGAGRVDVWSFHDGECLLQGSAEVAHAPIDIALLAPDSEEFLTLGRRSIMFWRCPQGDAADCEPGVKQLQFQVAEPPDGWDEGSAEFTAFCVVQLSTWRLLLVGTSQGRVWAYNADENQVLAELCLAADEVIGALACAQWPLLVCAVGDVLMSFVLEHDEAGCLQAVDAAAPLRLDGQVLDVQMHSPCGKEGVASTSSNALWYFHITHGLRVQLQSFHKSPSRALRSNAAWLLDPSPASGLCDHQAEEPCEALATGADDGSVRLWSHSRWTPCPHALAEFEGDSACVAISFLGLELLAAAFLSGSICLFSLQNLEVISQTYITQGDPLLAMETVGPASLAVGTADGQLLQLRLPSDDTAASNPSTVPSYPPGAAHTLRCSPESVDGTLPGIPLCNLTSDFDRSPRRLLACFANLELRVFDCHTRSVGRLLAAPAAPSAAASQRRLRLTRCWVWPESHPELASTQQLGARCRTETSCLELLSSPPLIAAFVPLAPPGDSAARGTSALQDPEAADLVVACAPPATCLYVFSCARGLVLNRIELLPCLQPLARLWAPPWPPAFAVRRQAQARFGKAAPPAVSGHGAGDAVVLAVSGARVARLHLEGGGARARWLGESLALPASGLAGEGCGLPAVCLSLGGGGGDCSGANPLNTGFILKGGSGLSSWEWSSR